MASTSSASKVAKLAQKGKGKKVRFQGGTLFPAVVVIVVVLLGALIVYARQSRPGPGQGEPTSNQHWHAAVGFYVCDPTHELYSRPNLTGALEETGSDGLLSNQRYISTGVHSHDDGVMHWHANSSGRATGTNAKLKVFLDNYGVELTNDKLSFPEEQGGDVYEEGKTKCTVGGVEKDASLKLWVWDSFATVDTAEPQIYTTNMGDVRIKNDGMAFMIAFAPDDTPPRPPATAFNLPELGAADGGGTTLTTLPNTDTTAAGTDSTTAGSTVDTAAGEPSDTTGDTGSDPAPDTVSDPGPDNTADSSTATTSG